MSNALRTSLIQSVRELPAPPSAVFEAFRDSTRLALWWGPAGFTNVIHEFDFRAGGRWRFTMIAPDGNRFENTCRFTTIKAPSEIAFIHEEPVHAFLMTMHFDPTGVGTRITWEMRFDSVDEAERVREFILPANEQNFDRLAANLLPAAATPESLSM